MTQVLVFMGASLRTIREGRAPNIAQAIAKMDGEIKISADPSFVQAARGFLESWLIRKDYDAAFGYLSPKSYACYNLERGEGEPAIASPEEAGRRLRAALEASGKAIGPQRSLECSFNHSDISPCLQTQRFTGERSSPKPEL